MIPAKLTKGDEIRIIIATKAELRSIPVVADLNFGHTTPCFTFPVGGSVKLSAFGDTVELIIAN